MKVKSLAAITLLVLVALTTTAQGQATQARSVFVVYGGQATPRPSGTVTFKIDTSDPGRFLFDPVNTLRRNGITLTAPTEAAWRELTVALRRLTNPRIPQPAGTHNRGDEVVYMRITMKTVEITAGRGLLRSINGGLDENTFLSDPVGTLRANGVEVPTVHERWWRQLASAVKVLRRTSAERATNDRRK